ncbi:MAG: hypothetical protein LBH29_06475 [Elusimicrobiota bacterium]|nr:hypothetical protein [Elusimicrobiota bacterium]
MTPSATQKPNPGVIPAKAGIPVVFAFAVAFEKKTAESGERLIINRDCGFRRK